MVVSLIPGQTLRDRIRQRLEEKQTEGRAQAQVNPAPAAACDGSLNLGYRVQTFSHGLHAAIWYPTRVAEAKFEYPTGTLTAAAVDAPVADCQRFPLIVFSHGFGACGIQSLFFTEALARAGYIVAAPDHKDSSVCSIEKGRGSGGFGRGEEPFGQPDKWTAAVYKDRADDVRRILDELPRDSRFAEHVDVTRIGGAGHSLGGYTIMGLVGGWDSWRDDRIRAALLLSPYAHPFVSQGTVGEIRVPVMYQSGTRDIGVDPILKKSGGAYDASRAPKFFEELPGAGHGAWSNLTCLSYGSVPQCNQESATAKTINQYAVAFFDRYLFGRKEPVLDQSNGELADYRHKDR
jgi:predicted dienelactone hydrolase